MTDILTVEEALEKVEDGITLMLGGFLGVGAPLEIIDTMADKNEVKDLTLITVVGGYPGGGFDIGKLSANKQLKKVIAAHIGTDPELVEQYNSGDLEVEFNPMGTFIERIRAGGGGLGGVLTPVGLGTEMEEGRDKIEVEGNEYLVYPPLTADVAIIKAAKADKEGNLVYRGTSLNTNPVMATAADYVIAEVDEIVEVGEIDHNQVDTSGIFVDGLVEGYEFEERKEIFTQLWDESNKF